jgi:hypothetical protein
MHQVPRGRDALQGVLLCSSREVGAFILSVMSEHSHTSSSGM